jgi:prepilin peptidase CpaA
MYFRPLATGGPLPPSCDLVLIDIHELIEINQITDLKALMGKLNAEVVYASCSVLCALIGAAYDLTFRRIPNALTLPAMLFGLLLHFTLGGWRQLGTASAAGLLCCLIFLPFHLAGGMGAGDVKLVAAAGSIAGLPLIGNLLIFTALAGGVMALGLALYRRQLKQTLVNICALVVHHRARGLTPHPGLNIGNEQTLRLPYGLAIAAGSTLSLCLLIVQR